MSSSQSSPETLTKTNEGVDVIDVRERIRNEDETDSGIRDTAQDVSIQIAGVKEELVSTAEQRVPAETTEAMTASTSVLPQVDDQAKVDKLDKNSVATTLTSTLVHSQQTRSSRRRINQTSTSEGALTTSFSVEKRQISPQRQKPSLLSNIFRKIFPCIGPSHSHDTEIGDTDNVVLGPSEGEKQDSSDRVAEDPSRGPSASDAQMSPSLTIPSTLLPPPKTTGSEIIIPPSPTTQLLPLSETEGVTSGAVQPPGSTGDMIALGNVAEGEEDGDDDDEFEDVIEDDEEDRLIRSGGNGIPIGDDGVPRPLLPPIAPQHVGRKCLVLDLDETLVHSSFRSVQHADFVVPVQIEHHWHNFYVLKRPGVDNFLRKMGEIYEVVVFTASLSTYADPVMDQLDIHQVVAHRLFRESCYNHRGNYVKDLSQLGRPMRDTIILDNSPASYIFHQNNAVPVSSWFNDPHDTELTDLCPFLADLCEVHDVRGILDGGLS